MGFPLKCLIHFISCARGKRWQNLMLIRMGKISFKTNLHQSPTTSGPEIIKQAQIYNTSIKTPPSSIASEKYQDLTHLTQRPVLTIASKPPSAYQQYQQYQQYQHCQYVKITINKTHKHHHPPDEDTKHCHTVLT